MRQFIAAFLLPFVLTACVNIKVEPKGIVDDTVKASKELYRTVKAKSNDMEERVYSYVVANDVPENDGAATQQCFVKLKELANSASQIEPQLFDQQSEITTVDGHRAVRCSLIALVKPD